MTAWIQIIFNKVFLIRGKLLTQKEISQGEEKGLGCFCL